MHTYAYALDACALLSTIGCRLPLYAQPRPWSSAAVAVMSVAAPSNFVLHDRGQGPLEAPVFLLILPTLQVIKC